MPYQEDDPADYVVGADLGKTNDPAVFTCCLRRRAEDPDDPNAHTLCLRLIHQVALGTGYPGVIAELASLVAWLSESQGLAVSVAVDATGVGQAVMDDIRLDPVLKDVSWGVTLTSGQAVRKNAAHPNDVNVPKKDLVGALQVALQKGRLSAHPTLHRLAELKEQMLQFQESKKARVMTFEGQGETHDDYVMSLANAAWLATYVDFQTPDGVGGSSPAPYTISKGFDQRAPGPSWRDTLPGGAAAR